MIVRLAKGRWGWLGGFVVAACFFPTGPDGVDLQEGSSTSSSTNASNETSTDGSSTVLPTTSGRNTSTDASSNATDGSVDDGDACLFAVCGGDVDPELAECSLFLDDDPRPCPRGEKCTPRSSGAAERWNALVCSSVAPAAGAVGDECRVEGSSTSGIDDCSRGAICSGVDPDTNEGVCTALCSGSAAQPSCPDGLGCWWDDHDTPNPLVLCGEPCDPTLHLCPEGQGCHASFRDDPAFVCLRALDGAGYGQGDPCIGLGGCDPGLACIPGERFGATCEGDRCCTAYCNANDVSCPEGLVCAPWWNESPVVPGLEHVGVCTSAP